MHSGGMQTWLACEAEVTSPTIPDSCNRGQKWLAGPDNPNITKKEMKTASRNISQTKQITILHPHNDASWRWKQCPD